MFKRIARLSLQAESVVGSGFPKIPKDSRFRYVIPFVKLPEWDNTEIINKFVEDTKKEIKAGPKEFIDIDKASLELSKLINGPKRLTGTIDIEDGKLVGKSIDSIGVVAKIGSDLSTYIYTTFGIIEHVPDFMVGAWFMGAIFVIIRPLNSSVYINTSNIDKILVEFRERKASKSIVDEINRP